MSQFVENKTLIISRAGERNYRKFYVHLYEWFTTEYCILMYLLYHCFFGPSPRVKSTFSQIHATEFKKETPCILTILLVILKLTVRINWERSIVFLLDETVISRRYSSSCIRQLIKFYARKTSSRVHHFFFIKKWTFLRIYNFGRLLCPLAIFKVFSMVWCLSKNRILFPLPQ